MASGELEAPMTRLMEELQESEAGLLAEYDALVEVLRKDPLRFKELSTRLDEVAESLLAAQRQLQLAEEVLSSLPPKIKLPERLAPADIAPETREAVEPPSPPKPPTAPAKAPRRERVAKAMKGIRDPDTPSDLAELVDELEQLEALVEEDRLKAVRALDPTDLRTWLKLTAAWSRHVGQLTDVQGPQRERIRAVFEKAVEISKEVRPGFVHGLAADHAPEGKSWLEDAEEAYWDLETAQEEPAA
ncbi:MAG: hypothetical protein AAGJ19_22420 [Myxococcota bacterium]